MIIAAISEVRKTAAFAMSTGSPRRAIGTPCTRARFSCSITTCSRWRSLRSGTPYRSKEVLDELLVLGREAGRRRDVGVKSLGQEEVQPVAGASDITVQPVELGLQLARSEPGRAEDTQPSGVRHRGDEVATVAEGEDRVFESDRSRDVRLHGALLGDGGASRRA